MKILDEKGRRRPAVPIVPLMDILVILLIFFVVTTTWREKKKLLPIELPKASSLPTQTEQDERVVIGVTPDLEIFVAEQPVDLEQLAATLSSIRSSRPEAKLQLDADENIPLGFLLSIWESLTEAGYEVKDAPARLLKEK